MKSSLFTLLTILGTTLILLLGYGAWYSVVAAKSAAVAALEGEIRTKTDTGRRIAAARETLAELAGDERLIQHYFVSESAIVDFINYLEARGPALATEVDVASVATGEDKTRPTLLVTLAIRGAFDAVMRTIGSVEYAPYDLSITGLIVTHELETWRAEMKLVVGSVPVAAATSTPATTKP
jgi:hypothetical protein